MKRLFLILCAAIAACPTLGRAASLPPVEMRTPASILFVELVVNGRQTGEVLELANADDRLMVDAAALSKNGLLITAQGQMDVAHTPGLTAHYDANAQTLAVVASDALLPVQTIETHNRRDDVADADTGAMLNYDLYLQRASGRLSASLWTEQRLFSRWGIFSNTGTLRWSQGRSLNGRGYLRYDTRISRLDETNAIALTAGDLITRSLPWSTSVRLGGIQIARDFHIRPDLVTMPLPSFAGSAAVPSSVDLFVDGYRRQGTDVAPGRFVLNNVPVVNGAGQATIVTTDAVGRQIATTIPFYVASELLRPGLTDFAAELGFLRRNYGVKSFSYGAPAASGSIRRGMTPTLTLEAHGEIARALQLGGVGVTMAPWRMGTITASAAMSNRGGATGRQWSVGYNYTARRFGISAQHDVREGQYRDLGNFDLKTFPGSRTSNRIIGSMTFARQGSVGLAYIASRSRDGDRSRLVSASYSRPLGRRANLFASIDHDFAGRGISAQLRLMVPFGRSAVTGGVSHARGRGLLTQVDYDRAVPAEGGLGVDAGMAVDRSGRAYGQATATWRGPDMQFQAGTAIAQSSKSTWGSATGALIVMNRELFATNQVSDAFAVVATGAPGVAVSYENQWVGTTSRKGNALIPNVTSFLPVRFSIDTLAMAADYVADAVEQRASVRGGAGAVIRLPVHAARSATMVLTDAEGHPLAVGGRVEQAGHAVSTVGWDGVVYLEDVTERMTLAVTRRDGSACTAAVHVPADAGPLPHLGKVQCL